MRDLYGITGDLTEGEVYAPEPGDDEPEADPYEPLVGPPESGPLVMPSKAALEAQATVWQVRMRQQAQQRAREHEFRERIMAAVDMPPSAYGPFEYANAREIAMIRNRMLEGARPCVEPVQRMAVLDPQAHHREREHLRTLMR